MGIKETLNKNPVQTATVAGLICVAAIGAIIWQISSQRAQQDTAPQAFFSADDGQTWFLDTADKTMPFDHDGKQAYGAVVFRCGEGKPFVGYLQKWSTGAPNDDQPDVKPPGAKNWVSATLPDGKPNPDYQKVAKPKCPDGSGTAPTRLNALDPAARP